MQKQSNSKITLTSIFVIGVALRLFLFLINPPNNTYDDHLQVINIYANTHQVPTPSLCWECYQPPLYYVLSATVYNLAKVASANSFIAWKFVQLINTVFSILVLVVALKILNRLNLSNTKMGLYFSFIAFLPVDIFTSSMIGNDYMLVFSAIVSFYFFHNIIEDLISKNIIKKSTFIYLSIFVAIGCLSKQHGLILLIFPSCIFTLLILFKVPKTYSFFLPILIIAIAASFSNELVKYRVTEKFLVSNQDFFNYAKGQFPGSVKDVEFTTLRINSLFREPFMSERTAASFPTELFARTFFDYEWRFLSPKIVYANFIGRIGYGIGILWLFYLTFILLMFLKSKSINNDNIGKLAYIIPMLVGVLFLLVPFIQTLRFPFFSSMKSTFALPGILILLLIHAYSTREINLLQGVIKLITCMNILYGIVLIYAIYLFLPHTEHHLSGPLWPIP